MNSEPCPFCKEPIKPEALVCPHCQQRVSWLREELMMAAVARGIRAATGDFVDASSVTGCKAFCVSRYRNDRVGRQQCLDNCEATSAVELIAEQLQRDLVRAFAEIIWGGGDIDPVPLELAIRERLSRGAA